MIDYNLELLKTNNPRAYAAYRTLMAQYDSDEYDPYIDMILKKVKK